MRKLIKILSTFSLIGALALAVVFFHQIRPLAIAKAVSIRIDSTPISSFQVGVKDRDIFGRLRFTGGIEYSSPEETLGGISGIRVLNGGQNFIAVSDKGAWFSGRIIRDTDGRITAIQNARIAPMRDRNGDIITSKKKGDAEGIEIIGDQVFVSFERKSRINRYQLDLDRLDSTARPFRNSIRKKKLPNNNGLEAITVLEQPDIDRPTTARMAVFSEHSLDDNGDIRGFVSKKKKWREFSVRKIGDYKITDATLLPDGNIAILERQFSIRTGPLIRIRKLDPAEIIAGARVDGEILFEADIKFQIDNLEGLSAWVNDRGQTILTLVSDNNFSFLQRNLMLEFEYLPEEN